MSGRIRVGVLMGGASSEREISLASGTMVAQHLPKDRYEVVMLDTLALMAGNRQLSPELREQARALLSGGGRRGALLERDRALPSAFQDQIQEASQATLPATEALMPRADGGRIDVAFLALHGKYGEDGTLQGMLDLLGIPYVGSGTLASALAMDKAMAKKVLEAEGVPVPRGMLVERAEFRRAPDATAAAAAARALPAVVKPAAQGSSIGMSMVADAAAMRQALEEALSFDSRALVEERLVGTELTVGVIGNRELQALPVVEIVSKRDFFDYRAKYDPALSEEI
jgi:D-alanine--D-alanine ligase